MPRQIITDILDYAPNVRCFAIASDDLARQNSVHATRQLPKKKRKPAARRQYNTWKRSVDSIIDDAKSSEFDDIIARLESLPLDAVRLTFDINAADTAIDNMGEEIRQKPWVGIGIWEQFVAEELVFVWLWNDF